MSSGCPPPGKPGPGPKARLGLVRASSPGNGGAVGGRPAGNGATPGETGEASDTEFDGTNNRESGDEG